MLRLPRFFPAITNADKTSSVVGLSPTLFEDGPPPFLTGPNYAYLSQRDLGSSLVGTQCSRRDASAECRHEAEAPTAFPRCRSCGRTDRGIRLWCIVSGTVAGPALRSPFVCLSHKGYESRCSLRRAWDRDVMGFNIKSPPRLHPA